MDVDYRPTGIRERMDLHGKKNQSSIRLYSSRMVVVDVSYRLCRLLIMLYPARKISIPYFLETNTENN